MIALLCGVERVNAELFVEVSLEEVREPGIFGVLVRLRGDRWKESTSARFREVE